MMSGRGLGHTGGTLDKLEAIPGLTTMLSTERYTQQLKDVGCAIFAPTSDIAPVDKAIYALRDVTGTTDSLPLIGSSIMSKKIAENPDALTLDVKTGRGAFLREWEQSLALAQVMIAAGEGAGIPTVALLTNMDQPLGYEVGNWNESFEANQVLLGAGPSDVRDLSIAQAGMMLKQGSQRTLNPTIVGMVLTRIRNGRWCGEIFQRRGRYGRREPLEWEGTNRNPNRNPNRNRNPNPLEWKGPRQVH